MNRESMGQRLGSVLSVDGMVRRKRSGLGAGYSLLAGGLFMILFLSAFPAYAGRKDAKFSHIPVQDELTQGIVFDILQDTKGFMWFATNDGLARYDGQSFRVYRKEQNNPASFGGSQAMAMIQDCRGNIWIGTNEGLSRFEPETERFTHFVHDPGNPGSLGHDVVRAVCEDPSGGIWVGTLGGGVTHLDPQTGQMMHYRNDPQNPDSLSDDMVWTMAADNAGIIWAGTLRGGLNRLDPKTGSFIHYRHDPNDPNSISLDNTVGGLSVDKRTGTVWVGTESAGLNRLDPATGRFTRFVHDPVDPDSLSQDLIRDVYTDRSGCIWVSTFNGGLNCFNPATGKFAHYRHDPNDPDSLATDSLWGLCEDRTGNIWIGTFFKGIDRFNPKGAGFAIYRNRPEDAASLSNNFVTAVAEDAQGTLWAGTLGGGLNRLDRGTGRCVRYQNDPENPISLSSDQIRSVAVGASGMVWVGTEDAGLNRLDPATGQITRYAHDPQNPNSLSGKKVMAVLEDREGMVWAGTFDAGLNRIDPRTNQITRFRHSPIDPESLGSDGVWGLHEGASGELWIGTYGGGLSCFDRKTDRFVRYQNTPGDSASLSNNGIYSICESASGDLWIGTARGLNRFDRVKGTFVSYGREQGLATDAIGGVLEDDTGLLWISSTAGLSRLDPRKNEIQNFGADDLLFGSEFYWGAYCKTRDGTLFFGRPAGLTWFRPEGIRTNPFQPTPAITRLYLFNRPVATGELIGGRVLLPSAIEYTKEITLDHRDSVVSFEFSALHYAAPEKNKYAYMLEGFETDWNQAGNRHFVTYTNLPPGKYAFRVRASNNHGLWDEKGITLGIRVLPAIWNTWWFRGLYGTGAVLLLLTWYQIRTKSIRRRSWELEQTVAERTQALEAAHEKLLKEERMAALGRLMSVVSHELRNPLGVIRSSIYYLQAKLKGADDPTLKHLSRIDAQVVQCNTIVEELLEYTAGKAPVLRSHEVGLFIEEVLDGTAAISGVRVICEVAPDLPAVTFDRDKMRRVIVNLLQNAAQALQDKKDGMSEEEAAGYDPWIKVRAFIREDRFFFEVEDNGHGMDPETLAKAFEPLFTSKVKGTGLGLAIARKIVEGHKGTLTLGSLKGERTTATVSLPMGRPEVHSEPIA